MHTLGIDVGKTELHACLLTDDSKTLRRKIENTGDGCATLVEWLVKKVGEPVHACMEATGGWEQRIAVHLHAQGHTVSIVNPQRTSAYAQSEGARSKTDRADAARIARFCQSQRPSAWTPPSESERTLTDLVRRRADLEKMRVAEGNRLEAPIASSDVRHSIERSIAVLEDEIGDVSCRIRAHIDEHDELKGQRELITSIPGIAGATAEIILGELGDLMRFQSARQLASFCGLVPCEWSSGTSVHRRPAISKRGNARLRAALFYPAMSAMRHNSVVRDLAERLRHAGKNGMQIVVAAMRKLLHLVFGVVKNNAPFDPAWARRT